MKVVEAEAPYNQRWREGRASYRPARETINTLHYEIAAIKGDKPAREFILQNHYSAAYPAARRRFGLYRRGLLVGVAVFGQPTNNKSITNCFPWVENFRQVVELSRFVLLDGVEANGETFFLGRCFELLRRDEKQEFRGVLSFSDPVPRAAEDGTVTLRGHLGSIYASHNGVFTGLGTPRTLKLIKKTGRILSERTIQKVRKLEKGWYAAVKELEALGAEPLGDRVFDEFRRRAWLAYWVGQLTTPLRHHGNLRYLWGLDKRAKRQMPASLPYPKWHTLAEIIEREQAVRKARKGKMSGGRVRLLKAA